MKLKRTLKILIIFMIAISIFTTVAFANPTSYDSPTQFDAFAADESHPVSKIITNALNIGLNLLRIVALGWAIIMLIFIAMKYMISTPDIRGQLKKDMPTYVLGSILLFGASGILKLLTYFTNDTF